LRVVARPLTVLQHQSRIKDMQAISELVEKHEVSLLVCGYPLNSSGMEGQRAAWVRRFLEELAGRLTIPTVLWDETYSTKRADSILRQNRGRVSRSERKTQIDALAAAVILQDYLDTHLQEEE
ncbi:MAG: Holliday junction resolvase RuvX, partial [Chloroflexota bacterium]